MTGEERSNTGLDLTNPGAAQSVLRPLCLLSGFAAQAHVSHTRVTFDQPNTPRQVALVPGPKATRT